MLLSEGQMSDHKGAAQMFDALPLAKELLGDRGHDSNQFRSAMISTSDKGRYHAEHCTINPHDGHAGSAP